MFLNDCYSFLYLSESKKSDDEILLGTQPDPSMTKTRRTTTINTSRTTSKAMASRTVTDIVNGAGDRGNYLIVNLFFGLFFWSPFFIISVKFFFLVLSVFLFIVSAWGNYDDFYDDYNDDDDNDWDLSCLETGTTTASEESGGAAKVVVVPRVEQLLDTTIYKGPSAAEEEEEKEKEEGEKQRKEFSGAGAADAAASASAVVVVGESARVVDNYLQLFPGPAGTRLKVIILL